MELEQTEARVTKLEMKNREWRARLEDVKTTKSKLMDHIARVKQCYKVRNIFSIINGYEFDRKMVGV